MMETRRLRWKEPLRLSPGAAPVAAPADGADIADQPLKAVNTLRVVIA